MGDSQLVRYIPRRQKRTPIVKLPTAVLASGGMDSCILLANEAEQGVAYPIYVETGIPWEWAEKRMLQDFIAALDNPTRQTRYDALATG